jgi:predicted  nucleic acid-binding Zn-ribbon protein
VSYEFLTLFLSLIGVGFTLNSNLSKQIDQQNIRIERLYEVSQQNWNAITKITNYLEVTQIKLSAVEKDISQIETDLHFIKANSNGHEPSVIYPKNNDPSS